MTNMVTMTKMALLLQQKLEHLAAIYVLTEKQAALIDSDDTDALLENIERRQFHITAIEGIENMIPERTKLLMDQECVQIAVQINDFVNRTKKLDSLNQQKARDRLVFLKGQMQKVSRGRRTGDGYDTKNNDMGGTFFDSRH